MTELEISDFSENSVSYQCLFFHIWQYMRTFWSNKHPEKLPTSFSDLVDENLSGMLR